MTLSETLIKEFDEEMKSTRRVLERVPSEKGQWKPHEKSFSVGHLTQLVAWMPGWIAQTLTHTELVLGGASPYSYEKTETLLDMFDKNVKNARAALEATNESSWDVNWSLKFGDRTILTQPRRDIVRNHLNHLYHHRGQLTVYLRLIDVPVPGIYGPSADERVPGF
jgi:uncharacterized damage-inducible protein DinB